MNPRSIRVVLDWAYEKGRREGRTEQHTADQYRHGYDAGRAEERTRIDGILAGNKLVPIHEENNG